MKKIFIPIFLFFISSSSAFSQDFGIGQIVKIFADKFDPQVIAEQEHRIAEKVHWATTVGKMVKTVEQLQQVRSTIGSLKGLQEQMLKDKMAISDISKMKGEALEVIESELGLGAGVEYFDFHDWYMGLSGNLRGPGGDISLSSTWERASTGKMDFNSVSNSVYMGDVMKARAKRMSNVTDANGYRMAARAKYRMYTIQKMEIFMHIAKNHGLKQLAGFDFKTMSFDSEKMASANDNVLGEMVQSATRTLQEAREFELKAAALLAEDPMSPELSAQMKRVEAHNQQALQIYAHVMSRRGGDGSANRLAGQRRTYRNTNRTTNGWNWKTLFE